MACATSQIIFSEDLESWICQNESSMALKGLNTQAKKFHATVAALPTNFIPNIRELLNSPPENNQYDALKQLLISRFSVSQENKIRQLLTTEKLGDQKPTQFLAKLRSLAGGKHQDTIVKHIFLNNMSENVQQILCLLDKNCTLDDIAQTADRIHDKTGSVQQQRASISAVQNSPNSIADPDIVTALVKHIEALTERLLKQQKVTETRGRPLYRSNSSYRRASRSKSRNRYCYYHNKFGNRARKCAKPCKYATENSQAEN